ncbi:MAG: hypothetical protein WC919_02885 [Candidatus Paceibacterota bacterium]|jgi:hypothetical protein
MPVEDKLVAEINTAIETAVKTEEVKPETVKTQEVAATATVAVAPVEAEKGKEADSVTQVKGQIVETPKQEATSEKIDPAVVSEVVPVKPPAKETISDEALMRAIRAGLSLDDARSFPNEASLSRVVDRVEAAQKPAPKTAEVVLEEDPLKDLSDLDPEIYEPEVIKMFDTLIGVVKKQNETINGLKANADNVARSRQDAHNNEVQVWFDSKVAGLGEDFKDALGSGATQAMSLGSPQRSKRDLIANKAAALISGYRATGQEVSRDEVFDEAARIVLKDDFVKAREKKLSSELESHSSQLIARANAMTGKAKLSPQEELAAELDQKFFGGK